MNIDDQLGDAMRRLASDSPLESEVAATVRARINRRHHHRRTVFATLAAVAAVAAIVTTASLLRSPADPDEIPVASPPQIASSSSVSAPPPAASSSPVSAPPPAASSAPVPATSPVPASSAPLPASSGAPAQAGSASAQPSSAPAPAIGEPVNTFPTNGVNTAPTGPNGRCYATAAVGRTDNHLAFSIGGTEPTVAGSVALDICRQDWESGTLSSSAPFIVDKPAPSAGRSAPDLVICVLPAELSDMGTEEVAVFPGSADTCRRLNLPKYTG